MKPLFDYFAASRSELAKVSWPTRRQTARLTFIVIIFSLVVAGILGLMDMGFSWLLQNIIIKG
jgi:preprotein translocase SecE subunit